MLCAGKGPRMRDCMGLNPLSISLHLPKLRELLTKSADDSNGHFTICEDFIIQCNKQRTNVLCLREMPIETRVKCRQDCMPDTRVYSSVRFHAKLTGYTLTRIRDSNSQKFIQHIPDDLCRMDALLVYNRVLNKQLARRQRSGLADFRLVVIEIRQRTRADKFV
jgi:hypothetical protein